MRKIHTIITKIGNSSITFGLPSQRLFVRIIFTADCKVRAPTGGPFKHLQSKTDHENKELLEFKGLLMLQNQKRNQEKIELSLQGKQNRNVSNAKNVRKSFSDSTQLV